MVSLLWWKGEDTSPASFEKALSTLSAKITQSQLQLDTLRQRSRRYKALWTLYTIFAYLLCAIIFLLVVGWKNWGALQYTVVGGSPLFIYLIRNGISAYYTYRVDRVTLRLEEQQTERAKTIDKLKAATKYNSTQQLLEKYGGATPQPSPKPKGKAPSKSPRNGPKQALRTGTSPPATANIYRGEPLSPPSAPFTPQPRSQPMSLQHVPYSLPSSPVVTPQRGSAEFAPNAFQSVPQYDEASDISTGGNWYDRVLDVLLGEDETASKNRFILICKSCKLVNGQAPPGTKRMEDVGLWRCMGCGEMNGVVDEVTQAVEEMKERVNAESKELVDNPESKEDDDAVLVGLEKESQNENGSDEEMDAVKDEAGVNEKASMPRRRNKSGHPKT